MYIFLDILLTLCHLIIIGFNLLGWIWRRTRKMHLITIGLTFFSWFVMGIWYGWGYCFLTDWHWVVKGKLGETHLPASFISYMADKVTGIDFKPALVDQITVIFFFAATFLSLYFNFMHHKKAG